MRRPPHSAPTAQRSGGFSLLELAIAIGLIGVVTGGAIHLAGLFTDRQSARLTHQRLAAVETALVLYVTRTGALPCPADAMPASPAEDGRAQPLTATGGGELCRRDAAIAAVPWRALGIAREVSFDGWGRRFTYAVYDGSDGVTRTADTGPSGLDLRACSCPGPDCRLTVDSLGEGGLDDGDQRLRDCLPDDPSDARSQTDSVLAFLRGKGLSVRTDATRAASAFQDPDAGTGAAFVLISHGPSGHGAYGEAGLGVPVPGQYIQEQENTSRHDGVFVNRQQSLEDGPGFFDDLVVSRTIDSLARAAGLYLSP